jgi:hypothetical protein
MHREVDMKNILAVLLLALVFGTGYMVGQYQGTRSGGEKQDVTTSKQETNLPSPTGGRITETAGHSQTPTSVRQDHTVTDDDSAAKALSALLLRAFARAGDAEPERPPPPHETMDFSRDPPRNPEQFTRDVDRFLTEEEKEEQFLQGLRDGGRIPLEHIEAVAKTNAELREKAREELALAPSVPPPPPEEYSERKERAKEASGPPPPPIIQ